MTNLLQNKERKKHSRLSSAVSTFGMFDIINRFIS